MVDSGTIILVKGTSGSGKSTRVYCFLDFLESIGMELKPYKFVNIQGEEKEVGLYSEELDMVFLGKFYQDGNVRRWQGLDSVTGRLHTAEGLTYFLKEMGKRKINVLIEGAGTTVTWRLRPMELTAECEFLNILFIRYDYTLNQHEEYFKRVEYRSGKTPKGDSMWRKRKGFESDYLQSIKEADELNAVGANIVIYNQPFSTPPYDLGCRIFEFFGMKDLCAEYKAFVNERDYISMNSFSSFNK